jgi:hypothetical protein
MALRLLTVLALTVSPAVAPASGAASVRAVQSVAPVGESGGPGDLLAIAGGIAGAGAVLLALGLIGRRTRRNGALPGGAPLPGHGVRIALRSARATRATIRQAPATPSAAPPDPTRDWQAEIEWRRRPDGSRFCMTATLAGSSERIAIGESSPLAWPPTGPDSVEALTRAVERLESSAVAAGWRPAPPGPVWYAKRFTWHVASDASAPLSSPPAPPPLGTGRFQRLTDWPDDKRPSH